MTSPLDKIKAKAEFDSATFADWFLELRHDAEGNPIYDNPNGEESAKHIHAQLAPIILGLIAALNKAIEQRDNWSAKCIASLKDVDHIEDDNNEINTVLEEILK